MIKAVIFDMDGLIIDSESIQSKAFETIIKCYGKKPIVNKEGIVHTVGITEKQNWLLLKKKYKINENINELMKKRNVVYIKLLRKNVKPMPGFMRLLKTAKSKRLKIAIASSSITGHIEIVISKLKIKKYFDGVISGQYIKRSKPHPDIYSTTAKLLKIRPEYCLVLEDSQSGVEAAKKARMKVIAVPNRFTKNHNFSKADMVVNSLNEINL